VFLRGGGEEHRRQPFARPGSSSSSRRRPSEREASRFGCHARRRPVEFPRRRCSRTSPNRTSADMLFCGFFKGRSRRGAHLQLHPEHSDRLGGFFISRKEPDRRAETHRGTTWEGGETQTAAVGRPRCATSRGRSRSRRPTIRDLRFSRDRAASKGDEDKIGAGLNPLEVRGPPTFDVKVDGGIKPDRDLRSG